ncbi:MAG: FkbM family methyltransferase [Thaumarchaeota archaeon]|nr:FkbM family methyltransferase [Nitrososphaerota archaeon]
MTRYKLLSNVYYGIYNDHRYLYNAIRFLMYIYHSINGKDNTISINGWKMKIHLNDPGISSELALFKIHEPISTQILNKLVKGGHYCLDIGANIGYYALLTAGIVGKTGHVMALEPHPANFSKLLENVSINNLSNIDCSNVACSNHDGKAIMETSLQSNWHRIAQENGNGGLEVQVRKVDTLARNLTQLNLMRMDVEGHEYEVIEGSHNTIGTFKPALFMEFHPTLAGKDKILRLLTKLKNYGYEIEYFIPRFLDWPVLGRMSHVKKLTIEEYIFRIEKGDPTYGREANVFLS